MSLTKIGCAIWGHKPWIGTWLPEHTKPQHMLTMYSERLSMVEINATFYGIPDRTTLTRWVEQTPATFRFCPKVPRSISHAGILANTLDETKIFIEHMQQLGEKLGTIFLQLSPRFEPQQGKDLFKWLKHWTTEIPLAVEVRHPGWYTEPIAERLNMLLAEHNIGRVIVDSRAIFSGSDQAELVRSARKKKPDVPLQYARPTTWSLVRFMGHIDQTTNDRYLKEWAPIVSDWHREGHTTYFAMHCPDEGYSPGMCQQLATYIEEQGIPRTSLIPQDIPDAQQLSLF